MTDQIKEQGCTECRCDLNELARDKGIWYWCQGCGTLYKSVNGSPIRKVHSPGTLAALRAMVAPPRRNVCDMRADQHNQSLNRGKHERRKRR